MYSRNIGIHSKGCDNLKIGSDIDNVLNNLTEVVLDIYNKDSGDNLKIEDIKTYKIDPYMKQEYMCKLKDYFHQACSIVTPINDSQKYLEKIYNDGHEICIVTSSYFCDMTIKYDWIKKHYPFIKKDKVWVVHDKPMLKLDYLFDDRLANLIDGEYKKVLFSYPWNENMNKNTENKLGITRVHGWEEFYNVVSKDCRYEN